MTCKTIKLLCTQSQAEAFSILFQEGVFIEIPGKASIAELLSREWGLGQQFIQERIQTIFLDGHPVDQPEKIIPAEQSTLALSAAMPGLVGATMRKSGPLATLRESITCRENASAGCLSAKRLCLKLFNVLLKELGPHFLKQGILLESSRLQATIRQYPLSFWDNCQLLQTSQGDLNPTQINIKELMSAAGLLSFSIKIKENY